jgi:hypothetical protein
LRRGRNRACRVHNPPKNATSTQSSCRYCLFHFGLELAREVSTGTTSTDGQPRHPMSGQVSGQGASLPRGARRQDQGPRKRVRWWRSRPITPPCGPRNDATPSRVFPKPSILRNEPTVLWWEVRLDEIMGQVVVNFWKGRFVLGSSPLKLGSVGVFLAPVLPLHHDFHVRFGFGRLWAYQS